jgi:hypothetical protein
VYGDLLIGGRCCLDSSPHRTSDVPIFSRQCSIFVTGEGFRASNLVSVISVVAFSVTEWIDFTLMWSGCAE